MKTTMACLHRWIVLSALVLGAPWALADNLTVGGNLTVNEDTTLKGDATVEGDLTVDGEVDADTLDGYDSSEFPRKNEVAVINEKWVFVGPVGVGKGPFYYNLDVKGPARIIYNDKPFPDLEIHRDDNDSGIRFIDPQDAWYSMGIDASDDQKFKLQVSGALKTTESRTIVMDKTGKVGIGTNSPSERLTVNGKIKTKEVIVTASGWPDFVFEEDYPQPSLEEWEQHIEEKGHLPGIPSKDEVDQSGVGLGEMQRLLLQKIEELTLIILEQNETLTEQRKTFIEQNRRLVKQTEALVEQDRRLVEQDKRLEEQEEAIAHLLEANEAFRTENESMR